MASNVASNIPNSKSATASTSTGSAAVSQSGPSSGTDGYAHKRSGGTGSFGAGQATRTTALRREKNQASRKPSRKPKLTHEDAMAESAVMNSTRNRKGQTSITHLMNFSLPPRPSHFQHDRHGNRHARRNPTWGLGSGYHAVDKARYVHANYRFIVDPRHDYRAQAVDADVYLDWGNIMQILASPQSQASACPICLGDPVAPRMAKCGHIFCLHCLIRYMHSSDEHEVFHEKRARWKKCPICWDSIYISETRPVRWYIGQEGPTPHENEDIVLRLVMRPAGSTLALPRDVQTATKEDSIPWHFAANVMDYARVMKGSEDYMLAQFDEEIVQLEELEKHDELMFGEDTEWTSRAIRAVKDAKEKTKGLGNPAVTPPKVVESKSKVKLMEPENLHSDAPEMYKMQQATRAGQSPSNATPTGEDNLTDSEEATNSNRAGASEPTADQQSSASALSSSLAQFRAQQHMAAQPPSDYYFYQALVHYYLSPLDIRILKAAFGEFSAFPSTILPRVERISSSHIVDEDLRKRAKYLAHLPFGCEVAFLECDWTDTVPSDVLEKFKPDIERRRKRHSDKDAREEKERVRAEKEEEDKRYAAARRKRPSSPVERLAPDDFQPLAAAHANELAESLGSGGDSASPGWHSRGQTGSAFASLASPSTSPSAPRTVWGTAAVSQTSPILGPVPRDVGPPPDDGWLQGWERDLLQEEELVAQVASASLASESPKISSTPGGKKKKGKKITLMSTTNARRGA